MDDLLFKCQQCTKHLVVDGSASGKILKCVDCGQPVQVPRAEMAFKCPSCSWDLSAPSSIAGEAFHCPNCEQKLIVPEPLRVKQSLDPHSTEPITTVDILFKCPHCAASLTVDRKSAGKAISCPTCKKRIIVPGLGTYPPNGQDRKKIVSKKTDGGDSETYSWWSNIPNGGFLWWVGGGLSALVLIVFLVWYGFAVEKQNEAEKASAEVSRVVQERVEQERLEKVRVELKAAAEQRRVEQEKVKKIAEQERVEPGVERGRVEQAREENEARVEQVKAKAERRQKAAAIQTASEGDRNPEIQALVENGLDSAQRGDAVEAARYFRLAAERGSAWGQNNLGCAYMGGQGVLKDVEEGARWIAKAAAQGLKEAQAALGSCYTQGWGVEKDAAQGARWYRKAAEQGDAVAQRQLSLMYAVGMGVPKSNSEAVKWAREAASRGDEQASVWIAKWDAYQGGQASDSAKDTLVADSGGGSVYFPGLRRNYAECCKAYGNAEFKPVRGNVALSNHKVGGFNVHVIYVNTIAEYLKFSRFGRSGQSIPISDEEMGLILKANSFGRRWLPGFGGILVLDTAETIYAADDPIAGFYICTKLGEQANLIKLQDIQRELKDYGRSRGF